MLKQISTDRHSRHARAASRFLPRRTFPGRLVPAVAAAALVAVAGGVTAMPAAATPAPACASQAADTAAARVMARRCGTPVEATVARTGTGRVFANPDGTSAVEEFAYPQRIRRPDGTWEPLDATLVAGPDGTWSPRASTVDLKLSGGGAGALVTAGHGGTGMALSWRGALPEPSISGASATYRDVLPGVDLVVTATGTGFGEVVVVRNRAAAADPALRRLTLDTSLTGLRWQTTGAGTLEAVDGRGAVALAASAPVMWDSSAVAGDAGRVGGRPAGSVSGPAEGARTAPIGLGLTGDAVTLTPPASLLDDPEARFPLFIDPTISYSGWTMINSQYPSQSYWSYDKTDCPSGYSTECAKVGRAYGTSMTYRSMWQFSTSGIHATQILASKFTIDLLHTSSTSNQVTELRQVNATIGSGTTWNNNASTWSGTIAATVSNTDNSDARKLSEFSSGTLTSLLQTVANGSATTMTWGLRAPNEGDQNQWKKFDAKTARMVVTTNRPPAVPDQLTVDGRACVSGANRPVIATATPALRAHVTDPDGDTMNVFFAMAQYSGGSFVDLAGNGVQNNVANGGTAQVTPWTTLVDGGIYTFRAQSNDQPSHPTTAYGVSPVTNMPGNCEWQVDLTNPVTPAVTGDVYPENCNSCGSPGTMGTFTFSGSSSDVVSYRWGTSSPPTRTVAASPTGGGADVYWTPSVSGPTTLYVQAVDAAGRTSTTRTYQFYVGAPTTAVARWKLDEAAGASTLADDTGHGYTMTPLNGTAAGAPGRLVPGLDGVSRTAVSFDGVDDYATSTGPVLADTSRNFSVSAWVKLTGTATTQHMVSQGGSASAAFLLEYDAAKWKFTTPVSDSSTAAVPFAGSTSTPKTNVWTLLTGVYDAASHTTYLYVNGALEGTTTGITVWDANGALALGGIGNHFSGSLGDVQVWDRALSGAEAFDLYDPVKVSNVADYHFDEVGPGPTYDSSGMAHDLTFFNGASIPATGAGQTGTGLLVDGVDDYAAPDGQVLATNQSFTVSVWVRLADKSVSRDILTQPGTATSPFLLQYNVSYDRWVMNVSSQDTAAPVWSNAPRSTSVPALNTWTRLVAVYDAGRGEMRLYVNGVLEGTSTGVTMWSATGAPLVGKGFTNNIDELRIYQGAVTDVTAIP